MPNGGRASPADGRSLNKTCLAEMSATAQKELDKVTAVDKVERTPIGTYHAAWTPGLYSSIKADQIAKPGASKRDRRGYGNLVARYASKVGREGEGQGT